MEGFCVFFINDIFGVVNVFFFFGVMVGVLVGGLFVDKYGCRIVLMVVLVLFIIGGVLIVGSVYFVMLIVVCVL